MSSYWQAAKREAKRRARLYGYCWVWSNPEVDWKHPYLFLETSEEGRPHGVPCHATRYGDGPPRREEPPEFSIEERLSLLEERIERLERQQPIEAQNDE